jgi:mannose-6-phosphate isomerase-like protein (cupin superfamily)
MKANPGLNSKIHAKDFDMEYNHNAGGVLNERHKVIKAWGWEEWIWNSEKYCGKILFFERGKESSYHYHKMKDETFYIAEGLVLVRYEPLIFPVPKDKFQANHEWIHCEGITLKAGQSFHVTPFMRHQIHGLVDSRLIEFSTFHDDNDSYRLFPGTDWKAKLSFND